MAKTKETKVAVKGEDPKKAPRASKTARKVPPPSEEIVKDSDSSSSSDSESNSGSDSESELEKQKSTKKPNVKKAKATEPSDAPGSDDSSDESSHDDEDSSDDGDAMKTLKAGKASKKQEPATVSTNGKVSKSKDVVSSSDEESDEDESSAKAGAAEESDGSDEDMEDAPEYSSTAIRQAQAQAVDPTRAVAPQPYEPPAGYKHLDTSKSNATTLDQLLANPGSKQIWHITAPSSVPISQIQSVSLASIQNQSSILSHRGTDYTLAEEKESKTTKKVFVPGKKGYNPSEVPVSKSLVLQQVISIPELDGSNIGPKPHRGPRPQPKGLRMRYKPFGFGAGDPGAILGSDESEDEDINMTEPVAFQAPAALRQSEKEKERKRKRDEKEAAEQSSTPRGEKKRRKDKEGAAAATKKPQTLEPEEDKQVLEGQEDAVMQIEESLIEGTQKEVPQTEEEKARKKAEKKEKKEKKKSKK